LTLVNILNLETCYMRKETKYTKKQILEAIDYWKD